MSNSQKIFFALLIIILVALVGGGIYYSQNYSSPQTVTENTAQQQSIPIQATTTQIVATSTVAQTADQNSGWQTYTNADFSIQYPLGWVINTDNSNPNKYGVGFGTSTPNLDVWSVDVYKKTSKTAATLLSNLDFLFGTSTQKSSITIDGIPAMRVDISLNDVHATHIVFENGNNTYDILGGGAEYYKDSSFINFYNSFKLQ